MHIDENDVHLNSQNLNSNDSKDFKNVSKTIILYDCKFVDYFRFLVLEYVSNEDVINENRTNHENEQHTSFLKNRFSDEDRQFRENHDLFRHFLLNFLHMRISFQSRVNLYLEYSNVDFRLNRIRVDFDRDCHVKLFRIFDEMNQLIFDRDKHKFMTNRLSLAKLVHFSKFDTFRRFFSRKSECWHRWRTRKISCSCRICCTFSINQHCRKNKKSQKTKTFQKFLFTSKKFQLFVDSSRELWSDRTKNCWFNK
jgi:hypothetical protein